MTIIINQKKIIQTLSIIVLCLTSAHVIGIYFRYYLNHPYVFGLVPLFNFDEEMNIPTMYSSLTLLLCSILLMMISLKSENENRYYWIGLAIIFIFLSIDEFVGFHELLVQPIRLALDTSGVLYFAWIIPYGIAMVILFFLYIGFIVRLPSRIRNLFISAGLVYVAGAAGMELWGGYYFDYNDMQKDLAYAIITTFEELLEMIGILIFLYALFYYLRSKLNGLSIKIKFSTS